MARRFSLLLALLLTAAAPPQPASLVQAKRDGRQPITRDWLVGYWAYEGTCESRLETRLLADGTFTMGDGAGRWTFSGRTLTIHQDRPPTIHFMQIRLGDGGPSAVRRLGPNAMRVDWGGGVGGRFVRCD